MTWHDPTFWSIRPDCTAQALDVLNKIDAMGGGLHRDNIWKQATKDFAQYFDLDELPIDMTDNGIAVVSVSGVLVDLINPFTANYPALTAAFEHCRTSEDVRAVVVRFKTPGGTVCGLRDCAKALDKLSDEKLTIGQVDGGCYSAGYYLASYCGEIRCGETDHVGNIGVVSGLLDFSEAFKQAGIRPVTIRTGPIKGLGLMGDPITGPQEEFLTHMNRQHFAHFRSSVMSGRGMNDEQFEAVSDGRWWTGAEAVGVGIVDTVSSLAETLEAIGNTL